MYALALSLAAAALLPVVLADPNAAVDPPRLYHRLFDPAASGAPWAERGTLALPGPGSAPSASAHLVPADTLEADLAHFAQTLRSPDAAGALYQLALARPGAADPAHWHVSAVKACHLPQSTSEDIRVHLAADGTPYALDYFVAPVPRDGACPKRRRKDSKGETAPPLRHVSNTTVSLVHPRHPPLPQLRVPPPLALDGKPVEPVPEKTFLQKYWIYMAVALFALLVSPGGEEEGSGQGAAPAGAGAGRR